MADKHIIKELYESGVRIYQSRHGSLNSGDWAETRVLPQFGGTHISRYHSYGTSRGYDYYVISAGIRGRDSRGTFAPDDVVEEYPLLYASFADKMDRLYQVASDLVDKKIGWDEFKLIVSMNSDRDEKDRAVARAARALFAPADSGRIGFGEFKRIVRENS